MIVCAVSSFAETIPKDSVYQLNSTWRNQNNQEVHLKDFMGQKVIMGMVYTKCPHACPMLISKINSIENAIKESSKENYKIVIVSFDIERDTPENLKKYMKSRDLDESKWTFLTAKKDSITRELAVVLGISYKKLEDGEFSHSNVVSLLNKEGVRIAKIESLSAPIEPIVQAFKK